MRAARLATIVANAVGSSNLLTPAARRRVYRACGVSVGDWARIMPGQRVESGAITFESCFVNYDCTFDPGTASIHVGEGASLATGVTLTAASHRIGGAERRAGENDSRPIVIGPGAWLGTGVTVLPGVTVGGGAVVGAGSVVLCDVGPNELWAGVPAVFIRALDEPTGSAQPAR